MPTYLLNYPTSEPFENIYFKSYIYVCVLLNKTITLVLHRVQNCAGNNLPSG